MNVTIRDKQGNTLLTTLVGTGSKRRFQLMKEDYITLKFSLQEPVQLSLGDGIDDPAIGLFELADPYKPACNTSTGGYDYELRLDAYYWKWKNKKFFYLPEEAGREAAWKLTATLDVHLGVFLRNLAALGYTYRGTAFTFSIDGTVNNTARLVSYSNTNLIDALNLMAETWECEWWVTDHVIHFGRCEQGDPVEFTLGENVNQMTRSESQSQYITRMYLFGSERNIPAWYRKQLVFAATGGGRLVTDSQRPLQLSYFPQSAWRMPVTLPATVRLSGTATGSQSAYTLATASLGDLPGGVYRFVPGNLYARLSTAFTSNIENLSATVHLAYSDGVQERRVALSSFSESGTPTVSTIAVFPESKFELLSNASGCKLEFAFAFNVAADRIRTTVDITGTATIECAARQADAVLTFVSGSKKGTSYNAVFNPLLQEGEEANFIQLPEGVKADAGDQYTIDNLLKGRVPASYFTQGTAGLTVNGVVQTRLMLPEGTPCIDAYEDMAQEEAVEGIVVLDDIYPKRIGTLSDVHTRTETVKNDDGTEEEVTLYRYRDTGLTFSDEYIIPGKKLGIIFQSGDMNGMEFGVIFNPDPKDSDRGEQLWEIVRNDDYGRPLPDDVIHPSGGDKYILTGFDTSFVADTYLPAAEEELLAEGQKRMEQAKKDPYTYQCEMNAADIYNNGDTVAYEPGDRVRLVNPALFGTEGRLSRIIGYEWPLDIPYDHPVYTVGETAPYSRLGEIEGRIDELTYKGNEYKGGSVTGGGQSVYVIGTNDNTAPTDRNVYSAKRMLKEFLSKTANDTAAGVITFQKLQKFLQGLEAGEAVDSLLSGKGVIIDGSGRVQADRLELRGALVAMELLLNEVKALAGDYSFSDAGHIEQVEALDNGTYTLYIRKDTEADITSLDTEDIVYSIVNNLKAGGTDYYTSWMRVLTKNVNDNTLTVSLWPDAEVPGGKNYPPAAGYNLTRRGNTVMPDEGEPRNERAQSWLLSSREGRIMFLANVYKPILEDYNYALTLGKLPNLKALEQLPVTTEDVGLVAQTAIVENLYQMDYNGDVVTRRVPRGAWSLATAQGEKPYRNVQHETVRPAGTTYTLLEQHTVEHIGCTWGCLIDKTTDEPKWNAAGWVMLEGDPNFYLTFESSNGWQFFRGQVDTVVTAMVAHGNRDITEELMAASGTVVEWLRDSGNPGADNAWTPVLVDNAKHKLRLTAADMPVGFGSTVRVAKFICRVTIPVGDVEETIENQIIFK